MQEEQINASAFINKSESTNKENVTPRVKQNASKTKHGLNKDRKKTEVQNENINFKLEATETKMPVTHQQEEVLKPITNKVSSAENKKKSKDRKVKMTFNPNKRS